MRYPTLKPQRQYRPNRQPITVPHLYQLRKRGIAQWTIHIADPRIDKRPDRVRLRDKTTWVIEQVEELIDMPGRNEVRFTLCVKRSTFRHPSLAAPWFYKMCLEGNPCYIYIGGKRSVQGRCLSCEIGAEFEDSLWVKLDVLAEATFDQRNPYMR